MPPRKQKLSKRELRELIRKHGIRFEGPIPQKDWPWRYAHHFQAIRKISRVWYDDYKVDHCIPRERRKAFKNRINHLRKWAYRLLDDVNTNESEWRDFEPYILQRFDERVIWYAACSHSFSSNNSLKRLVKSATMMYGDRITRPTRCIPRLSSSLRGLGVECAFVGLSHYM